MFLKTYLTCKKKILDILHCRKEIYQLKYLWIFFSENFSTSLVAIWSNRGLMIKLNSGEIYWIREECYSVT